MRNALQQKQESPARNALVSDKATLVQPKLSINTPGDRYEQEADRVADAVMGMSEGDTPVLQKMSLSPVSSVQRAANAEGGGGVAPPIVSNVLSSGGGQSLDAGTQQFMESRFGRDFSEVRVHTDSRAAESAAAIQARAYTSGRDVVFGQGEYRPGSAEGRRLLAHELGHVGQQGKQFALIQRTPEETDTRIEEALTNFYHEFSSMLLIAKWTQNGIEMQVPISVRPPYFMNDSGTTPAQATVNRATRARQNRANNSDFQSLHISGNVLTGKGTLDEIRDVAQMALDRRIVKPNRQPTANDMRDWLERFGIGIDCSGFVGQSLNRVMARVYGDTTNPIRGGSTQLRNAATTVSRPSDLRPGDIMHHRGHIRILRHVEKTPNEVTFTTIESHSSMYSGYDATTFHGDQNSFGLDQAVWRYPNPAQFQSLERQNSNGQFQVVTGKDEHATYGRHPRLTEINHTPGVTRQQVRSDTASTQTQPAQQQSVFEEIIGGARVLGDWGSERIAASRNWISGQASNVYGVIENEVDRLFNNNDPSTSNPRLQSQPRLNNTRNAAPILSETERLVRDIIGAIAQNEVGGASQAPESRLRTSAGVSASYASATQMIPSHAIAVLNRNPAFAARFGLERRDLRLANRITLAVGRIWKKIVEHGADRSTLDPADVRLTGFNDENFRRMSRFQEFRSELREHRTMGLAFDNDYANSLAEEQGFSDINLRASDIRAYFSIKNGSARLNRFREDQAAYMRLALQNHFNSERTMTLDAAISNAASSDGGRELSQVDFTAFVRRFIQENPASTEEQIVRAAARHNGKSAGYPDRIWRNFQRIRGH